MKEMERKKIMCVHWNKQIEGNKMASFNHAVSGKLEINHGDPCTMRLTFDWPHISHCLPNTTDSQKLGEADKSGKDKMTLPTFEEGAKSLESLLDNKSREATNTSSLPALFWLLHRLTGIIAGDRWKPMDGKKKTGTKCSFICNVTNSDVAFAMCLLKHCRTEEQMNAANTEKKDSRPPPVRKVWLSTTLGLWNTTKRGISCQKKTRKMWMSGLLIL